MKRRASKGRTKASMPCRHRGNMVVKNLKVRAWRLYVVCAAYDVLHDQVTKCPENQTHGLQKAFLSNRTHVAKQDSHLPSLSA